MAGYRLSRRAEKGLMEIGAYTLETWGEEQALRYISDLEQACQRIAKNPQLGRASAYIRPGLYRIQAGRHAIFYRLGAAGVIVSRILHNRMLPERQVIE